MSSVLSRPAVLVSGRHDVACRARKCKHLQHLQSDGTSTKLFSNLSNRVYSNNVTNLHQLTFQSTTVCDVTSSYLCTHHFLKRLCFHRRLSVC